MQREKVFFRYNPPKVMTKQKLCVEQSSCPHFGWKNLSLVVCTSVEPASVRVKHIKFQTQIIYKLSKKAATCSCMYLMPRKPIYIHKKNP